MGFWGFMFPSFMGFGIVEGFRKIRRILLFYGIRFWSKSLSLQLNGGKLHCHQGKQMIDRSSVERRFGEKKRGSSQSKGFFGLGFRVLGLGF